MSFTGDATVLGECFSFVDVGRKKVAAAWAEINEATA